MTRLKQLGAMAQQVAEAIASVLNVEVTVADETLCRIAGTGRYSGTTGELLGQDSAFARVIETGRGFIISNPGQDSACITCEVKHRCHERAQVCCPIKLDGAVIGVIALGAFNDEQRSTLLEHQSDLFGFIDRMADLLASKAAEAERLHAVKALKNQLETVINTVNEGIIAVDKAGRVVNINASACKMTGLTGEEAAEVAIDSLLPGLPLAELIRKGREFTNREISRRVQGRRFHYLITAKPWREGADVIGAVITLREMAEVRKFVSQLSSQNVCYTLDMILGDELQPVKSAALKAAQTSVTVLIQGESGTGKELFARAIHSGGSRQAKPFIAVNCAAIPETLLESELFGYEEGAFTGARRGGKPGKFELADGGTLFLDEIGDMSLILQAKLLRVLQDRRIERVGGVDAIPVDVRIIAATHKDIEAMVKSGEFRQDLYYRINVFPITIPPLRQRQGDLPALIAYFLEKYGAALGKAAVSLDREAERCLLAYDWPGNVRELENTIEYLVNMATGSRITAEALPARLKAAEPRLPALNRIMPLAELEQRAIAAAIAAFGDTAEGKNQAAEALGISRATLYRRLKEQKNVSE
ncbi:MAG TPA: sigma 54-interacting transcriptional regulator [Selenomonadales bacterium]|nr:sigma 54-interacting transcriptional regulator [Selenomonadales bacterium]